MTSTSVFNRILQLKPEFLNDMNSYIKESYDKEDIRTKNKEYHSINYDNYNENMEIILKLENISPFYINCFTIICCNIEFAKKFYNKPLNIPTWIKFDNNNSPNMIKIENVLSKVDDVINPTFYMFYKIKLFREILKKFVKPINYMYNNEKKFIEHPNYHKGREYFLSAIDAADNMLHQLLIICRIYIQVYNFHSKTNITQEWINKYFSYIDSNSKQFIDSILIEDRPKHYKVNNKILYFNILDILMPSKFFYLFYNLFEYSGRLNKITYLYNLIHDKPNPTYLRLNIEIDGY